MSKKLCPCGATEDEMEAYRFMQYRPKEFRIVCPKCGRDAFGKGSHWHVMVRKFKEKWSDK